jgi:RIO kinase 1
VPRPEDVALPRRRERFEDRRKERSHRDLLDQFFDRSTLLAVSRLVNQGQFDSVDFPIATGKEGGVFRASRGEEFRAVKIYRIGNTTFHNLPAYALEELRRETSVRNYGGLIFAWTRREHTILGRLADAKVRAPYPYGHYRNCLVMEFIGTEEGGAPRLQDAQVDSPSEIYEQLVVQVGRMYRDAKLVHGDLSPYNTLYFEGEIVLIDVAQAVSVEHPQARALLERDLTNYARYLGRLGFSVEPDDFLEAVGASEPAPASSEG